MPTPETAAGGRQDEGHDDGPSRTRRAADLLGEQERVVVKGGEQDHTDGHLARHAHQASDGGAGRNPAA